MPLYDYKCAACGARREMILKLAELDSMVECLRCSGFMNRQLSAPHVVVDLPGYQSPIDDRWVEGRAARREDLARSGCRPYEAGEREAYLRNRKRADEILDVSVEETVGRAITEMPQEKREAIACALDHGLTPEIVRQ